MPKRQPCGARSPYNSPSRAESARLAPGAPRKAKDREGRNEVSPIAAANYPGLGWYDHHRQPRFEGSRHHPVQPSVVVVDLEGDEYELDSVSTVEVQGSDFFPSPYEKLCGTCSVEVLEQMMDDFFKNQKASFEVLETDNKSLKDQLQAEFEKRVQAEQYCGSAFLKLVDENKLLRNELILERGAHDSLATRYEQQKRYAKRIKFYAKKLEFE